MVVGYCFQFQSVAYTAFKWTQADGMVAIGTDQYARAVNNNGMIVGDAKAGIDLLAT